MHSNIAPDALGQWLVAEGGAEAAAWLKSQLAGILDPPSGHKLFMAYSLCGRKFPDTPIAPPPAALMDQMTYLREHQIRSRELARVYLLARVLDANPEYFVPKVRQLAQVADTGELVTLLRYLSTLPSAAQLSDLAVDALRTNIADVFDAIALRNPYPARYFNTDQWNQMYLKAAFMQRDLLAIPGVEARANADLARIISDYAHERWAASRDIDPIFWRPVAAYLDQDGLLADMRRLLKSPDPREQKAGYLVCRASGLARVQDLIWVHPLHAEFQNHPFRWEDLKAK
ncbi:EboA domain-containing protein [Robiginitalea sp. M366]|uniref:EboA domain-containing protein n=1 Tax=Robiginitalea aestuariiviva TaxID=3036903 RepID=UPI00240D1C34|nr:EboA domain-containing protein [Robiginitalea aestuariiviva]MDG1572611.1 EboA domain-containing protein [Robiginitalea aestuariiviva]